MDNGFTPGPWTAGGTKPYKGNECYIFDGSDPEKLIAYLGWINDFPKPSIKESVANAHLIAAAPNLLEALSDIIQHLNKVSAAHGSDIYNKMMDHASVQKAESAINKALNK